MSEPFMPTNQQKQILKLIYRRNLTFLSLSRRLHVSVEKVHDLCSGDMARFLSVDLPDDHSLGYGPSVVSITRDGTAYIEGVISQDRARRMDIRHFWIGIFLGGLLGWLLTSFGTPKDLLHLLGIL